MVKKENPCPLKPNEPSEDKKLKKNTKKK